MHTELDFPMALDAKVAGVAQAVAAAQKWKKGLFADVRVTTGSYGTHQS